MGDCGERRGGICGVGNGVVCWRAPGWVGREARNWNNEIMNEEVYLSIDAY